MTNYPGDWHPLSINGDNTYRYLLSFYNSNRPCTKRLLAFMCNPSKANLSNCDGSVANLLTIAGNDMNQYSHVDLMNLLPIYQSNPQKLDESTCFKNIGKNLELIRIILMAYPKADILLATGDLSDSKNIAKTLQPKLISYYEELVNSLAARNIYFIKAGTNNYGYHCSPRVIGSQNINVETVKLKFMDYSTIGKFKKFK